MKKAEKKDSVHDLRVETKRLRAQARLLKQLSEPSAKALNLKLRNISRILSPVRDRSVQNAWLKKHGFPLLPKVAPAKPVRALKPSVGQIKHQVQVGISRARLSAKKKRRLLEESRKKAAKAWKAAKKTKLDADFHEWRKRAKDLQYQLEFFGDRSKQKCLKQLTSQLGRFHDSVLMEELSERNPQAVPPETKSVAKKEKQEARKIALRIGRNVLG